ncbi:MAG: hypothetical protein OI715_00865 (plasmid) [Candidatus Methanoperedens sp.]|jgi:hypothetical protein|nr:MAG: hypothetical protein OI715_00865 [Candidatus Methanoperedens sp.]
MELMLTPVIGNFAKDGNTLSSDDRNAGPRAVKEFMKIRLTEKQMFSDSQLSKMAGQVAKITKGSMKATCVLPQTGNTLIVTGI